MLYTHLERNVSELLFYISERGGNMRMFKSKIKLWAFLFIIVAVVMHCDFMGTDVSSEEIRASGKYIAEHENASVKDATKNIRYIDPQVFLIACSGVLIGALGMVILSMKLDSSDNEKENTKRSKESKDDKTV